MLPRLLFLLGFLYYSFQSLAQTYEPGLLVRSNGDTLRGEIENSFWLDPPTFIRFRATSGGPSELFKPRQLRTVLFTGGRHFQFETLPIDHAAETRLDRLPRGYHPNIKIDSVLAEVLVDGPVSLLRVVYFSATHYLLRRPDQPVLDLSERMYLYATWDDRLVMKDGNNYHGQLGLFFGDCPAAYQAAQTAPFTPEGLASVIQTYASTCAPTQPTKLLLAQAAPRKPLLFQGGISLGGSYYLNSYRYPNQLNPFAGLYGEMLLPNRALAGFAELSVNRFHGQGETTTYTSQPVTVNGITYYVSTPVYNPFTFRSWLGSARVGLRYHFPLPHEQQWLLGFGLEYNRLLGPTFTPTAGTSPGPTYSDLGVETLGTLHPFISLGWRIQRITAGFDTPFYALRLHLSYRLSRNSDAVSARPAALK